MVQMPEDDTTPVEVLKRSAFTCAAVFADESVRGKEKGLRGAHAALRGTVRALEDLRETEQEKSAVLTQLDGVVDRLVNELAGRLLLLVDKDYEHPLYRRYVPGSVRDITQADMRVEEPARVAEIVKLLTEDEDKPGIGPLATEMAPRLQAANERVLAAEKDLAATESEAAHLEKNVIPALLVTWRTEYKTLEAALTAAWPLDSSRVQRCFKPFRKPKPAAAKKAVPGKPVTADGTGKSTG
ncbi:Hypothetical protein A7982_09270 [Minicystis rosea]|nr:Hypothetical protein A7982_09270 [Minicystis rosea]